MLYVNQFIFCQFVPKNLAVLKTEALFHIFLKHIITGQIKYFIDLGLTLKKEMRRLFLRHFLITNEESGIFKGS